MKNIYDVRYEHSYREKISGIEFARNKALKKFISNHTSLKFAKKILDYGAGNGLYVRTWEEIFSESDLYFCDISKSAKNIFLDRYNYYNSSKYELIKDNKAGFIDGEFDVIVSVEVMEHVENLKSYLLDIHRLLKPGGVFIWTTPCGNNFSADHIYSTITNSIQQTDEGYRLWKWEDPTHIRRLKSDEIYELLKKTGFTKISFKFRAHFFSFIYYVLAKVKINRPDIIARLYKKFIDNLLLLDYYLFRNLKNGASMIGLAKKDMISKDEK